jgi:hypothetical protein
VDDGWELAEFADEEAVGVANFRVADGLRVNFDVGVVPSKEGFREKKNTATWFVRFVFGCSGHDRCRF